MTMPYDREQLESYASALARVASLSNLFSESETPYLHYRTTEYLYARVLEASNLARSDITIDAKRGSVGVGLKTFVYNNKPKFEKIAEFNKKHTSLGGLDALEKMKRVAELRNERIVVAGRIAGVDTFIYHCIARVPGKLFVFEVPMDLVDVDRLSIIYISDSSIHFEDGKNKYRFSLSKSTLYKEFFSTSAIFEKPVKIYEDPFELLNTLGLNEQPIEMGLTPVKPVEKDSVILPLYGYKKGKIPFVFESSGLNQWNAKGRTRNENEVYIPIPAEVHERRPNFLPPKDQPFDLYFPDGSMMQVKVCQDNSKALMSKHNADLGEWLLRDILDIKAGTLVTYEMLEEIGIDAVEISKHEGNYHIDFKTFGSYERYINS